MDGYSYMTFDQRREIEEMYGAGARAVDIAAKIGRSVAAIYEELKRGYTGELDGNKRISGAEVTDAPPLSKTKGAIQQ